MTYYNYSFKVTLDNGPKKRVQWNWTFLLVKNLKLVPRHLNKDLGPRQINVWFSLHGIILDGKPIGPNQKRKKIYKRAQGLENQNVRSNVAHFFVFC
jgi:hypothetical protein